MAISIETISGVKNQVGEGPVWDVSEKALYWLDPFVPEMYRLDPKTGAIKSWKLEKQTGSFAIREKGGALCAMSDGFYFFDFDSDRATLVPNGNVGTPETVFNDGKTDSRGRFIAGTVDLKFEKSICAVYSLDGSAKCSLLDSGFVCVNGPCFSPDNQTFYCADSPRRTIYAYDYDIVTGRVSNKRKFASTQELGGVPDGATVDAEGHLWSAIAGGGKIACFNPDGSLARTVEMPTQIPASVMFGGDNLDVLYVPSIGVKIGDLDPDPKGGSLFAIKGLGVRGKPEPRFAG
jgi:L-arabinonolactonase